MVERKSYQKISCNVSDLFDLPLLEHVKRVDSVFSYSRKETSLFVFSILSLLYFVIVFSGGTV